MTSYSLSKQIKLNELIVYNVKKLDSNKDILVKNNPILTDSYKPGPIYGTNNPKIHTALHPHSAYVSHYLNLKIQLKKSTTHVNVELDDAGVQNTYIT